MPSTDRTVLSSTMMLDLGITNKDLELIRQLGLSYKVICENLEIDCQGTLRSRITRLIQRFGVENRTALVIKAIKLELVTPDEFSIQERK